MRRRVASVIAAMEVVKIGSAAMVEIARGKASTLSSSGPMFSFVLISCPAGYASSLILILRSILSPIVL